LRGLKAEAGHDRIGDYNLSIVTSGLFIKATHIRYHWNDHPSSGFVQHGQSRAKEIVNELFAGPHHLPPPGGPQALPRPAH
jgi:hypothetical protein